MPFLYCCRTNEKDHRFCTIKHPHLTRIHFRGIIEARPDQPYTNEDTMKFLLKPKRYGMNKQVYTGKKIYSKYAKRNRDGSKGYFEYWGSLNESNLILSSELDVVKFLRSRIVEDVADCAERKHHNLFAWIMERDGKHFSELIKYNHHLMKKGCEGTWSESRKILDLSSSPWNYKLFQLEDVVSHGIVVQRQKQITWNQFLKKCKAAGIEHECIYKEL